MKIPGIAVSFKGLIACTLTNMSAPKRVLAMFLVMLPHIITLIAVMVRIASIP